jgi:hypothetical protein
MAIEGGPDPAAPEYEAPVLRELGSVHALTLNDWPCLWSKTIGDPDYLTWIPITNCSS